MRSVFVCGDDSCMCMHTVVCLFAKGLTIECNRYTRNYAFYKSKTNFSHHPSFHVCCLLNSWSLSLLIAPMGPIHQPLAVALLSGPGGWVVICRACNDRQSLCQAFVLPCPCSSRHTLHRSTDINVSLGCPLQPTMTCTKPRVSYAVARPLPLSCPAAGIRPGGKGHCSIEQVWTKREACMCKLLLHLKGFKVQDTCCMGICTLIFLFGLV